MSCLYSNSFHTSLSNIAPKNSMLMIETLGRLGLFSHAAHMNSCVMVMCFVSGCIFAADLAAVVSCIKGIIKIGM